MFKYDSNKVDDFGFGTFTEHIWSWMPDGDSALQYFRVQTQYCAIKNLYLLWFIYNSASDIVPGCFVHSKPQDDSNRVDDRSRKPTEGIWLLTCDNFGGNLANTCLWSQILPDYLLTTRLTFQVSSQRGAPGNYDSEDRLGRLLGCDSHGIAPNL